MGNLDKFRYQQVPDIESGHDTDETASGVPREEQVKREVIVGPKEKVKLYLKSHHQKQFFSSIIDQENAGFKQLLLELEGVDWNFLHSIDRSIDLKEICIEILQDFTKSKLQPETVHVIISPRGIDLEPITNLNDLFPIPNPVPVLSKIQCTVLEQSKKTFHVLAKVFKCGSAECRDKSIIYMVQNTFHDITNKCDENFSQDWHEISLFKRSTNTGMRFL